MASRQCALILQFVRLRIPTVTSRMNIWLRSSCSSLHVNKVARRHLQLISFNPACSTRRRRRLARIARGLRALRSRRLAPPPILLPLAESDRVSEEPHEDAEPDEEQRQYDADDDADGEVCILQWCVVGSGLEKCGCAFCTSEIVGNGVCDVFRVGYSGSDSASGPGSGSAGRRHKAGPGFVNVGVRHGPLPGAGCLRRRQRGVIYRGQYRGH